MIVLLQHISTFMGTPIALWYSTVLLLHISTFMNNALTLNSMFTQSIFNLVYDSASAAHMYINGNIYCNGTLTATHCDSGGAF